MTVQITSDDFPVRKNLKEYEQHCVTYLLHNDHQVYVGETSHLKARFKDHLKTKQRFKLTQTKIIYSEYFNKSAVYDIESRLINYIYADRPGALINLKKDQSPHFYYLKEEINNQLFRKIWASLQMYGLASRELEELENSSFFKYSPFKEFSAEQLEIVDDIVELTTHEDGRKDIAPDGSTTRLRKFNPDGRRILVTGGPGTGKTLLIVKIVHDLLKRYQMNGSRIGVCIPQSNLSATFKRMFRETKLKVALIKPVDLAKVRDGHFDFLIVDEAHRLKQYFKKQAKDQKHLHGGKTTELELALKRSKHLVIMFDPDQTVRPADISVQDIESLKSTFIHKMLGQQFRIKRGADYLRFVRRLLQIEAGSPSASDVGDYQFHLAKDLASLRKTIRKLEQTHGLSRMASGYYREWISRAHPNKSDFSPDGLDMKWNSVITGWVNSPNALNEVGCIHTLQGEDLNYAGVIMGTEIWMDPQDGRIKVRKDQYHDRNGTPIKHSDPNDEKLCLYVKNIYYVLLTRGMLGTHIYVHDPVLRAYIQRALGRSH